jgi:hypothetical protein
VEFTGFADGLDAECEKNRKIKNDLKVFDPNQ